MKVRDGSRKREMCKRSFQTILIELRTALQFYILAKMGDDAVTAR